MTVTGHDPLDDIIAEDHDTSENGAAEASTSKTDREPTFMPIANPSKLYGLKCTELSELKSEYGTRRMLEDLSRLFIASGVVVFTWGPPGSRKTRYFQSMTEETDENGTPYQVVTIQPSTQDPTVIHGIMYTSRDAETGETVMHRSLPDVVKEVRDYHDKKRGKTVFFIDEITTCSATQQHALLGFLTHGEFGGVRVEDLIAIVVAANPENTVSTVLPLGEQVLNRAGHIPWYGNVDLFLEEWGSGFGHPELVPDETTRWYIGEHLGMSREEAFRDSAWSVDELVPYDNLIHSERNTTDLARVITMINSSFRNAPDEIRHEYIIEATRALQGPKWANRMAMVCRRESETPTPTKLVNIVKRHDITSQTTHDEVMEKIGTSMHTYTSGGADRNISVDTYKSLIDQLSDLDADDLQDTSNMMKYLTAWVFVTTTPDQSTVGSSMSNMITLFSIGRKAAKRGYIEKQDIIPKFLPRSTRDLIAEKITRLKGD